MPEPKFDLKLIIHNASGVNLPDDATYPFILEATFRPPSFMAVAWMGLVGGSEILKVRGKTLEDIVGFVKLNNFAQHIRLNRLSITEEVKIDAFRVEPNVRFTVERGSPVPTELCP